MENEAEAFRTLGRLVYRDMFHLKVVLECIERTYNEVVKENRLF